MKKTLLALAVSALSANAFAVSVDYTAATPLVNTIATELALPAAGLVTTTDKLTWNLGFSISQNTQRYIRISLSNGAKFNADPALKVLAATPIDGVISQGGAGFDYAILEVSAGADTIAPSTKVEVTLANLNLTGKNDVDVAYQLFETAVDAVQGGNQLAGAAAAPYIRFANGLNVRFEPFTVQRIIDVAATPSSTKFTAATPADDSAKIGGVAIGVVNGLVNYRMTTVALGELVDAGTALEVEGDFSAGVKSGGALSLGAAKLNGTTSNAAGTSATTLTATKATFVIDDRVLSEYTPIYYHVDMATPIVPSSYTANYNVVPVAGTSTASVNLGKVGELAKNGASQYVDLALKPGGAFQNYVRISNKTNVDGNVYITVIADDGQQQTISLGDVAGQSSTLAARSSTTQMTIQQIFDAAAAKGLNLADDGKLRLLVDGEFPTTGTTIDANNYGLSVQTYSVAKDGNSFNTF